MKRAIILLIALSLIGLVFANNSMNNSNENNDDILGGSCGTVTPGTQEQCCKNKGFSGWDEENFKCINERDDDEDDDEKERQDRNKICCQRTLIIGNESYTKYGFMKNEDCLRINNNSQKNSIIVNDSLCNIRKMNKTEIKEQIRERQRVKFENKTGVDCPDDCICTGVVMKCILEDGSREMKVYASSGNMILQIKDTNISTSVTLYKDENGTLYTYRNNEEKKIKFYPDQIRERARERIKSNFEEDKIELNEEGNYDISAKKQARFLYIFPVKERLRIHADPETGEIIRTKTSWWGFLARDKD